MFNDVADAGHSWHPAACEKVNKEVREALWRKIELAEPMASRLAALAADGATEGSFIDNYAAAYKTIMFGVISQES